MTICYNKLWKLLIDKNMKKKDFEVRIEYVELTPEEFAKNMSSFAARLDELFAESRRLEDKIKAQLGRVKLL